GYTDTEYSENVFSDVDAEDWFCDFVNIAYEKKLIKGIGDGLFGTGQFITRQDMCVMLCNALRSKGVAVSDSEIAFADKDEIADYAKSAVSALYEMGIVNGVSETEFEPLGNATRAQAAKVVYGALKQLQ
ncbi:MAG: S-layer homology domain-containing protein, partial [Clostridia bacterium]|nr:S-layer homology domain-containing protein [Clostridia bacterium]